MKDNNLIKIKSVNQLALELDNLEDKYLAFITVSLSDKIMVHCIPDQVQMALPAIESMLQLLNLYRRILFPKMFVVITSPSNYWLKTEYNIMLQRDDLVDFLKRLPI